MSGFGMIAGQAISEGMGLAFQGARDKLQESHIRHVNQKNWELEKEKHSWYTMQNDLQREKYDHSYNIKKLQEAGLNPGLMLSGGAGGAGGATQPIKGGEPGAAHSPSQGLGKNMAVEAQQMKMQTELAQAAINKTNAETKEIEARTPTHAKGIEKTDAEIQEIASRLNVNAETVRKIMQDIEQSKATVKGIEAGTDKTTAEADRIKSLTPIEKEQARQDLKASITRNKYLDEKEQAELDKLLNEAEAIKARVEQDDEKIDMEQLELQLKSKYPGLLNVGGGMLNQIMTFITRGKDNNYIHTKERRRK